MSSSVLLFRFVRVRVWMVPFASSQASVPGSNVIFNENMHTSVPIPTMDIPSLLPETKSESLSMNGMEAPVTTVNLNDMLSDNVNLRMDYDREYVIWFNIVAIARHVAHAKYNTV